MSGDGANNRGRPAEDARDEAVQAGVAINGLPILTLEPELDDYYRRNVIGGPGRVRDRGAAATRTLPPPSASKLITEIAGMRLREHAVDVGLHEVRVGVRR